MNESSSMSASREAATKFRGVKRNRLLKAMLAVPVGILLATQMNMA